MGNRYSFMKQYRGCLYQYAMRIRFKYGKDFPAGIIMKKSLGRFKPVFLKGDSNIEKLIQYKKLFKKIRIDSSLKNDFIYFIDEKVVAYNSNMTIDNMPINYNLVVNSSLEEIRKKCNGMSNGISKRNIGLIDIIESLINRIESDDDGSKKKQVDWIKSLRERPAANLEEALQRILFINQLLWQTDHLLNGLGRLDFVLERFSNEKDALQIITRFLKTLHCYYELKSNAILGDTGQVIILGGTNSDGTYYNNRLTYSFIQALEKLKTPDPKLLLRVSKNMPEDLLSTAVNCISTGCGSPLLSNDDIVIPSIESFGYEHNDACNYGVSACWEPLIIGNSLEQNNLFDIEFGKVFVNTYTDDLFQKCKNINEVLSLYLNHLEKHLQELMKKLDSVDLEKDPICSLFNDNCYLMNKDMAEGGSKYNNFGLLSVGLSSVVDSFVNIQKNVYEDKEITLGELVNCLNNDYEKYDVLRNKFSKKIDGFGSDSTIAVELTNKICDYTASTLMQYKNKFGGRVKFGLSSPAYVNSGKKVAATADGRVSGKQFNTHISREGDSSIVSIINFASKLDYSGNKSNGNVVDIVINNELIRNKEKFIRYLFSAINMGIFQMQFNVLSYEQLVDAKDHPDKYPNLIVRVWGFSAYFIDMPEDYQNAVIERAKLAEGR